MAPLLVSCSASRGPGPRELPYSLAEPPPTTPAFEALVGELARLDQEQAWSPAACGLRDSFASLAHKAAPAVGARALFNAALAARRCGDEASPEALLQRALALAPGLSAAHLELARVRGRSGDLIGELRGAVRDTKQADPDSLLALARALLDRGGPGDLDEARPLIEQALLLDGGSPRAYEHLTLYRLALSARSPAALALAGETCDLALARADAHAGLLNVCGVIRSAQNDGASAGRLFERAVALDPDHASLFNLGAQRLSAGKPDEAALVFLALLHQKPDDYEAHLGLALALRLQIGPHNPTLAASAFEGATRVLKKAIDLAPDRPEAHFNLAILHDHLGQFTITDPKGQIPLLRIAQDSYQTFLKKASDDPGFQGRRKIATEANERLHDWLSPLPPIKAAEEAPDLPPPHPGPFDEILGIKQRQATTPIEANPPSPRNRSRGPQPKP